MWKNKETAAKVAKITSVSDHPTGDKLSLVTVSGVTVVMARQKDGAHPVKPGDLVVYLSEGMILPDWLLRRMGLWNAKKQKGTLGGKAGNVVTVARLRKIPSPGLIYPVERDGDGSPVLVGPNGTTKMVKVGSNVGKFLGITCPTNNVWTEPARPDVKMTFRGWIMRGADDHYAEAIHLVDPSSHVIGPPLAKQVYEATRYGQLRLSLSYHITAQPESDEALLDMLVVETCGEKQKVGATEINYHHRYSELTGYLWTNEKLSVGGHDVIAELRSNLGRWCSMQVVIHGTRRR